MADLELQQIEFEVQPPVIDIQTYKDKLELLEDKGINHDIQDEFIRLINSREKELQDEDKVILLQFALQFNLFDDIKAVVMTDNSWINICDSNGRTPLLIAAYFDNIDLVILLINKQAAIDAVDSNHQCVIHYAVRNSSHKVLEYLSKYDWFHSLLLKKDYQNRTPLQLAADQNKTRMVDLILSYELKQFQETDDASAVTSSDENIVNAEALSTMIMNMPALAIKALDKLKCKIQPHGEYKIQYYYQLYRLESNIKKDHRLKVDVEKDHTLESEESPRMHLPFIVAVKKPARSVLTHPVMKKLIDEKWNWKHYRISFWIYLILFVYFLVVWSVIIAYPSVQEKHIYNFPDDIFRMLFSIGAVAQMSIYILYLTHKGITYFKAAKNHEKHCLSKLEKDLEYTCNGFPKEKAMLKRIMSAYDSKLLKCCNTNYCMKYLAKFTSGYSTYYFRENTIDIIAHALLSMTTILHIVDISSHTEALALWTARVACFGLLFIWSRLLIFARASEFFGPMIAIIIQIFPNILKYFFLFLVFYIPYVVCFWTMFGGNQQMVANVTVPSEELILFHRVAVVVLQLTYGQNDVYKDIRNVDELMGTILVISFLIITAIIGLNLFIALLSDTFQRIYDNAQATALYQKARLIVFLEEAPIFGRITCEKFNNYLEKHFGSDPNNAKYYDDEDDKQVDRHDIEEIKETLENLTAILTQGRRHSRGFTQESATMHTYNTTFNDDGLEDDNRARIYRHTLNPKRPMYIQQLVESKGCQRVPKFVKS